MKKKGEGPPGIGRRNGKLRGWDDTGVEARLCWNKV